MHRRTFLQRLGAGLALAPLVRGAEATAARTRGLAVETVRGPVPATELGPVLAHEHVLVDFIGADQVSPARYAIDDVIAAALPHLKRAHALGARTLFECTPNHLARDPRLLARLSQASGLHLVTNTGLYGVRQNKFVPAAAQAATARELAQQWIAESENGIGDTGIRPGFIKSGVDPEPALSAMHQTLVDAAALTHAATGLTIAIHTGRGPGLAILDRLHAQGVRSNAFVWVHAQGAKDDELFAAADRGAWISCDGLSATSAARHFHLCVELKKRGHSARVLLSHDAGWFDPAKPGGGTYRGYDFLWSIFLPRLREAGFSSLEIEQFIVRNPAEAFAVQRRLRQ